jgi:hypothetical protein
MAKLLSDAWTLRFQSLSSSPNPKKAESCNLITPPVEDKMVRVTQVQEVTTSVKDLATVGVSVSPNPISSKKKRPSNATYEMDYSSSDSYSENGGLFCLTKMAVKRKATMMRKWCQQLQMGSSPEREPLILMITGCVALTQEEKALC